MWIQERIDRLRRLVAVLIREGITPQHSLYGTRVLQIACGEFGVREQTAREYTRTLAYAWQRYRWTNWIKHNPYLTKEEKEEYIRKVKKNA